MANPQGRGTISVEIVGGERTLAAIVKVKGLVPELVEQMIHEAGDECVQLAQINLHRMKPPGIDTGALVQSIQARHGKLHSVVFSNLKYAPYIEFGTKPHFPPLDAIKAWVRRKLRKPESLAYPIARAIGKRGTPPRPFLSTALKTVQKRLLAQMKAAVAAGLKRGSSNS